MEKIEIDTDKNRLDVALITDFIGVSYWATGRTVETMHTLIDNSLNFGVYLDRKQIGYARVVTDYAQFAYLMDLFIIEAHRGKGYSKELMDFILNHHSLQNIKVWRLSTADAHGLYEKFGFTPLKNPTVMMEKIMK